jgi:hypothetical protein
MSLGVERIEPAAAVMCPRSVTGAGAGAAELVARRQPPPQPLGRGEIAVRHPEGREDVLAEVAVQRLSGDVFHDLPERRERVVGVGERRARLCGQPQPAPVELGEAGHAPTRRGRLAEASRCGWRAGAWPALASRPCGSAGAGPWPDAIRARSTRSGRRAGRCSRERQGRPAPAPTTAAPRWP